MTIDEGTRHKLHLAAEQQFGTDEAATLMAMLPPTGWADVATKGDFEAQRAVFTAQMDGLRTELHADMDGLRHELTAAFETRLGDVTRTLLLAIIGFMITTWAGLVGVLLAR